MKKIHVAVVALLVLTACATEDAAKKPAETLYAEAQKLGKTKRPDRAVERYQSLRTYYPGHELAKRSLIDLADLYYGTEDYVQASQSYDEFRLLYPTDPEASYCLFRIGLCSFNRLEEYDRDQTVSHQAVQILRQFVELYPASPYVDEAKSDINVARSLIVRQELSVADFYINKKKYRAACERLAAIEKGYGDLGFESEIADLRAKSCGKPEPKYSPTLFGRIKTFFIEHPLPGMKSELEPVVPGVEAQKDVAKPVVTPQADAPAVPVQPEAAPQAGSATVVPAN